MDKIVVGQREGKLLPDFLVGDRLLLLAQGQVVAGVDFSRLQLTDVSLDRKIVRVRLPAAEIFFTRLDSQNTRVYSRETGLLVPVDPTLETEVRQQAEQQLHDAALARWNLEYGAAERSHNSNGVAEGIGLRERGVRLKQTQSGFERIAGRRVPHHLSYDLAPDKKDAYILSGQKVFALMANTQAVQAEVEEFAAKLDIACCRFNYQGDFAFGSETRFPASFGF